MSGLVSPTVPQPRSLPSEDLARLGDFQLSSQRARRGILMPRGKNCRETIFAAQLPRNYPYHGGNLERGKMSSNVGRGNLGGISRDNLGKGN